MAKITPRKSQNTIVVKTSLKQSGKPTKWWNASKDKELASNVVSTTDFLKQQNMYRYRQASLYAMLYGNMPVFGAAGSNMSRIVAKNQLPNNRPTMSVITSITDTITSRISLNKPQPLFLTDNGDYKQRNIAKQMNGFIQGELYQTKSYELSPLILRDACIWGTGVLKVLEDQKKKVSIERRLATQLLVDANESFLGYPRQLLEMQLVDRDVLFSMFPNKGEQIEKAEQAYVTEQSDSSETISDQVMVVEAWHLPSGPNADDGVHVIACSEGLLFSEKWGKDKFPFAFIHYNPAQAGFWGTGVAERQMGNQAAINQLLMTIHTSINMVGVPRVFVEDGSKVVKAQINNNIGAIVTYRGTKPSYEVAQCVPVELYSELQNVINRAYQEEGVSQLASQSEKPAGLNSGEALREYDDIQNDRFSALQKRYETFINDQAYLMLDKAIDIADRDGSYQTIYPNKNGTKEINLPDIKHLKDDPFVIQCYDVSSLPKDPAGRLEKITEMMQAGLVSPQEGRRLLGYPDIEQEDRLLNASEERILKIMDEIVEDGKYTPPDAFMDIQNAEVIVTQYYNLYVAAKLEEKKAQMLRDFYTQLQALKSQAMQALQPQNTGNPGQSVGQPQASPVPPPQNPMIPNTPQGQ